MRPINQFQPQPPPQGGVWRMPQNTQIQQQRLLFQQRHTLQQQRMLHQHQQHSGLNAAIRELQQKTQHNQRHPLNIHNNPNLFQQPLLIRGQRPTSPHIPTASVIRPSLTIPPSISGFGLTLNQNQNIQGANFPSQPVPGHVTGGHWSQPPNATTINPMPTSQSASNLRNGPDQGRSSFKDRRRDEPVRGIGREGDKSPDNRGSGRNERHRSREMDSFRNSPDSRRGEYSNRDRGKSINSSRNEKKASQYHRDEDRDRDSGRSCRDSRSDDRKYTDVGRDESNRDRGYSRNSDRNGRRDYKDDDYKNKSRSSSRDERRSESDRGDRHRHGYSNSNDRFARRQESNYRSDRSSRARSPGSSRYSKQDDKSYGDSYPDSSRKKTLEDFLLEEDVNSDSKQEEEPMDDFEYCIRSCPADRFFTRNSSTGNIEATKKMLDLESKFEDEVNKRSEKARSAMPDIEIPSPPPAPQSHHHNHNCHSSCSSASDDEENEEEEDEEEDDEDNSPNHMMDEWERRKKHPLCLHPELWFNETGRVNDGPLCRCSVKSQKSGIRHDIYPGEEPIPICDPISNNSDRLHHYRVTMSPYTNFLTKTPTLILYDDHEYIFEGFSLFTHTPLENVPPCKLLRFNIEYTIHFIPEAPPENFTVRSLNLFSDYIFKEVLELLDLDFGNKDGGCPRFHFMPRFCRTVPDSGFKELLSMNTILQYLIKSSKPLIDESKLTKIASYHDEQWRSEIGTVRGMIVTKPGMRPSSIRIDQLDRQVPTKSSSPDESRSSPKSADNNETQYPLIIHQGYRPAQLSYAGDPLYRRAWKQYVKFRHLLNSKPKIYTKDKEKLKELEDKLHEICVKKTMKREVAIELNSKGFLCTGLRADLCQHALLIPVLMSHLRFHICLCEMEEQLGYKFKDRNLLQLALTHTSYRTNYGTNPDHTRNSLTNCGMRQVEYGDRRVHYQNTRKRGITVLLDIMSRFGKQEDTRSEIPHNERLEFLGDAVIEFLTSIHLFFMFPWLEEGGLSTYRMALVQNQHLAQLARKLRLQDFMLYVHGPDLCHDSDLRHAMANCCEALMGSLFLDGGLEVVDSIFSKTLFDDENILLDTWIDRPKHVLQQAEPGGDRHWVQSSPVLQKLVTFEESIGVKFNHIRLLAKAFTHRNIGDNPLTMGHNQRLEFLGDTVLQLVASEYLYRHYPEHHEGHLSLLRSSLVNSRTQAMVYNDLGMNKYVIFKEGAASDELDMKTKQRADVLEAFLGALYVDQGLDYCWAFCNVCFFPRLKDFIVNQDWNDPKSQLQQCCLTLREVGGGEPDIPLYKVIESIGPTNTRKYVVAVYFRGRRLATGSGHSIQQSEMAAASNALQKRAELFPILQHQRRFLEKMKHGHSNHGSRRRMARTRAALKKPLGL